MSWFVIGFWICLSILSTILIASVQASDSFARGYRRGYKDGNAKIDAEY